MLRSIDALCAASALLATANAQASTLENLLGEEEDPQLSDDWPRYEPTSFISIPEGATENNYEGFWQDGTYSTVTNIVGD